MGIEAPEPGRRIVHGVGLHGLRASDRELDCGNSGTAMRLLAGMLAGQAFDSTLVGDESLSRRPMRRVADPLGQMGARIALQESGCPPLQISGGRSLQGMSYRPPMASAQVKSAVLLAGLYARGRDHGARAAPDPRLHRAHAGRPSAGRSTTRPVMPPCRAVMPCAHAISRYRPIFHRRRSSWWPQAWFPVRS